MKKLMKKITVLLVAAMAFCFLSANYVSAKVEDTTSPTKAGVTVGGFNYAEAGNNSVKITGYSGSNMNVIIPDSIDGKTVSAIGKSAFNFTNIKSITIPGSVLIIEENSFKNCDELETVEFQEVGLQSIGIRAFESCSSLTNFVIPETVTTIEDAAFVNADGLKSISLPGGVTTLGTGIFYSCNNITDITLGDGLTVIGENMFTGCLKLHSITIPESVKEIGDGAFTACLELTEVKISKSVKSIGQSAFDFDVTIQCYQDSAAYKYAKSNHNKIKVLGPYFKENEITIYEDVTKTLKVLNSSKVSNWKSSDKNVVKVSQNGVITPVAKGKATVTAIADGEKVSCVVTVKNLFISKKNATVTVGKEVKLYVNDASSKPVWKTSNSKVAAISKDGVVTGKKVGSATITAVIKGKKYSSKIKVMKNAAVLNNSPSNYTEPGVELCITKIYYSGQSLVAEGYVINNTSTKLLNIVNLDLILYSGYQTKNTNLTTNHWNIVAEQIFTNYKLNQSPNSNKKVKFVFDAKNTKTTKTIDLRNATMSVGVKAYYSYNK